MIARLTAWLDGAFFFAFEEFDELRNGCFFHSKPFLTGMSGRAGKVANPG